MTFFRQTSMRISPVYVACVCASVTAGTTWIQNKRAKDEVHDNKINTSSILNTGQIFSNAVYCDGLISLSRHHTSPNASYSRSTKPIKCRDGTSVFPWSAPPREEHLKNLREKRFDVLVIGGGCVGNGVALDAITRGLSVAVVERDDFAAGTSGRSTKLIHGGVRYLEAAVKNLDIGQYNLVKEALTERAHMLNACPYLARALPIMIPLEHWWQVPMMWFGTKLYDFVAGSSLTVPPSMFMNKAQAHYVFPMLRTHNIYGAVVYYDGQMNDTRFALLIALTAAQVGATIVNHVNVEDLIVGRIKKVDGSGAEREEKIIRGAVVRDVMTGELIKVRAKTVVNCTGPFTDTLRRRAYELAGEEKSSERLLVEPLPEKSNSFFASLTSSTPKRNLDDWDHDIVVPAGGIHVMLPDHFSPANMGLIVPETKDGRVLFFLPWEGGTLCGTTDSKSPVTMLPKATSQEVDFVLAESSRYLNKKVQRSDVLAAWSGIRPLVKDPKIMAAEKKRREEEEKQKVLEFKASIEEDIKILNPSQKSTVSPEEKDTAFHSTKDEKRFAVALEHNNGKTNAAENELLQQKALKKGVDKTRDDTKSISREHVVEVNDGKMVTVVGGKWTTYRQMAEDAMDKVLKVHPDLASKATPCVTKNMMLIGSDRAHIVCDQSFDQIRVTLRENYGFDRDIAEHLTRNYGTRALQIAEIVRHGYIGREKNLHPKRLHPKYPFIEAELVFAVEQEYALTVEDFLARRIRLAFVDEKAARQVLPHAVELMAKLLNWNSKMKKVQFERASEFLNTMNVRFDDDADDQEVE